MKDKRKLKLKKFYFHPITIFIVLTFIVILFSGILSWLQVQATYNVVNANTNELEPTLVAVENLFSYIINRINNIRRNWIHRNINK